jgi:hypothetical protein
VATYGGGTGAGDWPGYCETTPQGNLVILTPRRVRPSLGPVVVSLAAGGAVLFGLLVNGCRINKLLSRSTTDGPLHVSPAEVRDSALAGTIAPRRSSLQVANSGSWFATNDSPWIGVTPSSGSGRRTVSIALDPQELEPGTHAGSVTVSAADPAEAAVTVPVTFVIQQPMLVVDPEEISHTARSNNREFFDTLEVRNDGSGPLVWTASHNSGWLTLGTVAGVGEGNIPLKVSSGALAIGTYKDTVVVVAVGASGSPAKIVVTLRRRRDD